MKKYLLVVFAVLATFALSAADRQPQVTLRIARNYEVTIDGQRYTGTNNNISYLSYGYHQVQVYSTSGGFIFKRRQLINSSSFELRNSDVMIDVDQNGQLRIYQNNSYGSRNGGYNNGEYDNRNRGNGNGYGPYNNPGRGHKYGLYKNKKNKNRDRDWDDRDDD